MNKSSIGYESADRAIEWFVRLRAENVSESEREGFLNWLHEAREHQHAFVEILMLWDDLSVVKQMDFNELRHFPRIWAVKRSAELNAAS